MINKYDVTIIGSGPGGYVAAIRCAQLGLKTAIIERYERLGGTCLNVGCIPSKALLDSTEHFHNARHNFKEHGIDIKDLKVNMNRMIGRKDQVVKEICEGVKFLMKKNKIDTYYGHGSFVDKNNVEVIRSKHQATRKVPSGNTRHHIKTDKAIIATGSKPASIPNVAIDKKKIITSTEGLTLKKVPKHIVVIGGGIIGVEMGSVFARLGSKITVVEYLDVLIPTMDLTLGKELQKILKKDLGFEFYFNHKVTGAKSNGNSVTVSAENSKGHKIEFKGDYCLVAVGRKPYTEGLGLENIGMKTDDKGRIEVNEHLQTSVNGIYAIGDVVKGAMLAHKAEDEGIFVAEEIAGQKPHIKTLLIPSVVYTWPEVAGVGYTEEQLKDSGKAYKSGSFPYKASGRAKASMDTDGLIKVLADKNSDEILGVHMIGPRAADMIAEAVVAMEYRASAEDIARMSHAHPSFTEAIKEACLAATENRALHL